MTKQWASAEKKAARRIFDLAAANAHRELLDRHESKGIKTIDELWNYELEIREWRKDSQTIFQYSYSHLESCFAICLRRGWLKQEDLSGLSDERATHISEIASLVQN